MNIHDLLSLGRGVAIAVGLGLTISIAQAQDFKRTQDVVSAPLITPVAAVAPAAPANPPAPVAPAAPAAPSPLGGAPEFQPVNIVGPASQVPVANPALPTVTPTAAQQPLPGGPVMAPPLAPIAPLVAQQPLASEVASETADPVKTDLNSAQVKQIVTDYLTELEKKKKAAAEQKKLEEDEKGHEVGSDLNLRAKWVEGVGLVFATEKEDWKLHVGGRFQFEPVFYQEPISLRGPATGTGGIPASVRGGGIGVQDDGAYFRRVRLRTDGVGYETIEFTLEVDFEQLSYITYDHMWVGMKDLPFLGTVRVGQHKVPVGMENLGSDYHLTLLERSSNADAFSILFGPGIWVSKSYFDDNVVFQTMLHKTQPLTYYTSSFGSGDYADSTRLTWTPLYEDEGREIVHVGGSYQWRTTNLGRTLTPVGSNGTVTGSAYGDSQNVVRFRARDDLRDGIGIGSAPLAVGSTARYLDTGYFLANNVQTVVPEFLTIWGPFSVQSELYLNYVEGARNLFIPGRPVNAPLGNPFFWGMYAEASYFLTGERRGYDRRFGMYDRPVLNENAFIIKDQDGHIRWNWGAWQVAYRYTYTDLNSGPIAGGYMGQHTMGLNWYINNTTKIQFQYNISQREVQAPAISGTVHGFGMLAQWYF